jgi:hypothetical protein
MCVEWAEKLACWHGCKSLLCVPRCVTLRRVLSCAEYAVVHESLTLALNQF